MKDYSRRRPGNAAAPLRLLSLPALAFLTAALLAGPHGASAVRNVSSSAAAHDAATKASTTRKGDFDPGVAADQLYYAMKGWGTNEDVIVAVTMEHTLTQRLQIAATYQASYGRSLVEHLKSETSGNLQSLLKSLYVPYNEFLARCLHNAVKGFGTDERAIIEVLVGRTNFEISAIKTTYKQKYGVELEMDLKSDLSGNFKRLVRAVLAGHRNELGVPTAHQTEADVRDLLAAGVGQFGTDESIFFKVLNTRSYPQLRALFDLYDRNSEKDIEKTIKSEFSGNLQEALLAIVRICRDPAQYYAKEMHKAMEGLGTDDQALIRIVVSRQPDVVGPFQINIRDIRRAYESKYHISLVDAVHSETSGNYRKLLLALINK